MKILILKSRKLRIREDVKVEDLLLMKIIITLIIIKPMRRMHKMKTERVSIVEKVRKLNKLNSQIDLEKTIK